MYMYGSCSSCDLGERNDREIDDINGCQFLARSERVPGQSRCPRCDAPPLQTIGPEL